MSSSFTYVCVGHVEVLLEAMRAAKVDGAFIIQPGNHLYDHSYVTSVLRAHPDKFVGALLANPTSVCLDRDQVQGCVRTFVPSRGRRAHAWIAM